MKEIINIDAAEESINKIRQSEYFTCKESGNIIKVRYHGTAGILLPPSTRMRKLDEHRIMIKTSINYILLSWTLVLTNAFWTISVFALTKETPSLAGAVISFLAPSIMWVLDIIISNKLSKIIIDEIRNTL